MSANAAPLLGGTAVRVQIEGRELPARRIEDTEEANVLVPARCVSVVLPDFDTEEFLAQIEEPLEDPGQRKVGPKLLLAVLEALLAKPLGPVCDVPVPEFVGLRSSAVARERLELGKIAFRGGIAGAAQLLQERLHFVDVSGHLAVEAQLGVARVAEQPRLLATQLEEARDDRGIVELPLARAGDVGAIEALAQIPAPTVLQKGEIARRVERDLPRAVGGRRALLPRCPRGLGSQLQQTRGQALHLPRLAQAESEGLGRVERVVAEVRGELGELLLDLVEAIARRALQTHPGVASVSQQALDDPVLRLVEGLPACGLAQRHEAVVDNAALAEAQREGDDLRAHGVVGLAQRVVILDTHQMLDNAPAERETVADSLERLDQPGPRRLGIPLQRVEIAVELGQAGADSRRHVSGLDALEVRKPLASQEGIVPSGVVAIAHSRLRVVSARSSSAARHALGLAKSRASLECVMQELGHPLRELDLGELIGTLVSRRRLSQPLALARPLRVVWLAER